MTSSMAPSTRCPRRNASRGCYGRPPLESDGVSELREGFQLLHVVLGRTVAEVHVDHGRTDVAQRDEHAGCGLWLADRIEQLARRKRHLERREVGRGLTRIPRVRGACALEHRGHVVATQ